MQRRFIELFIAFSSFDGSKLSVVCRRQEDLTIQQVFWSRRGFTAQPFSEILFRPIMAAPCYV
jgi:hypothetical protein